MIEKALNTLGKKRCPVCTKIVDKEKLWCKCGFSFMERSTPEDDL